MGKASAYQDDFKARFTARLGPLARNE